MNTMGCTNKFTILHFSPKIYVHCKCEFLLFVFFKKNLIPDNWVKYLEPLSADSQMLTYKIVPIVVIKCYFLLYVCFNASLTCT